MELYEKEFGFNFDLGFVPKEFPMLIDRSWHNDMCPSFYFWKNNQFYVLWVDFKNRISREMEDSQRYTIQLAENEGSLDEPEIYANDGVLVLESESFDPIMQFFKESH